MLSMPLCQMHRVGLYWAQIKGRLHSSQNSSAAKYSRTFLAMKYGYRWLNRVRLSKAIKSDKPKTLVIAPCPAAVTERAAIKIKVATHNVENVMSSVNESTLQLDAMMKKSRMREIQAELQMFTQRK